jgi:hypothetical protein
MKAVKTERNKDKRETKILQKEKKDKNVKWLKGKLSADVRECKRVFEAAEAERRGDGKEGGPALRCQREGALAQ